MCRLGGSGGGGPCPAVAAVACALEAGLWVPPSLMERLAAATLCPAVAVAAAAKGDSAFPTWAAGTPPGSDARRPVAALLWRAGGAAGVSVTTPPLVLPPALLRRLCIGLLLALLARLAAGLALLVLLALLRPLLPRDAAAGRCEELATGAHDALGCNAALEGRVTASAVGDTGGGVFAAWPASTPVTASRVWPSMKLLSFPGGALSARRCRRDRGSALCCDPVMLLSSLATEPAFGGGESWAVTGAGARAGDSTRCEAGEDTRRWGVWGGRLLELTLRTEAALLGGLARLLGFTACVRLARRAASWRRLANLAFSVAPSMSSL